MFLLLLLFVVFPSENGLNLSTIPWIRKKRALTKEVFLASHGLKNNAGMKGTFTPLLTSWENDKKMANISEDRNSTATQDSIFCTIGSYAAYQKLLISAVNITLSSTAFLGNILILIALKRVATLRPPSKLLLGCLASTDLCVGLITQPLFVAYIMSPEHSRLCYYLSTLFNRLSIILGGVSVSTITAISVERLLALLLGLRYRHVVTLRRVQSYVVISWFFSIVTTLTSSYDERVTLSITFSATILCIVTSIFSCTKIYLTLRNYQAQVQGEAHQGQPDGGGMPLNIMNTERQCAVHCGYR